MRYCTISKVGMLVFRKKDYNKYVRLSVLFLIAVIVGAGYFIYKYQSRIFFFLAGEDLIYTSCPCCCSKPGKVDPPFQCLYYNKGDRMNIYKNRDKQITNCSQIACTKPTTYAYCDP